MTPKLLPRRETYLDQFRSIGGHGKLGRNGANGRDREAKRDTGRLERGEDTGSKRRIRGWEGMRGKTGYGGLGGHRRQDGIWGAGRA